MKKLPHFLFLIISLLFCDVQAQNTSNVNPVNPIKNEIGLSVYGLINRSKRSSNFFEQRWFNGLMYKRHFGKNAFRLGIEYFNDGQSYNYQTTAGLNIGSWSFTSFEYRLGYQRTIRFNKFAVYFSLDIAGLHQFSRNSGKRSGNDYLYYYEVNALGVLPGFGIQYNMMKHLSVTAETSLNYYTNSYHNDLTINPLKSLSLNYHF